MAGLRHLRKGYFVQVPRETARDRRLGYKERGLLTFILDMPPGWEPTIDKLVDASDDDGKTAVASGVANLRRLGYYRLERRRRLDGTFEWGQSVAEVAQDAWAAEHAAYGGKAIPLVEQPDGSFKVVMPDGSLAPDGFDDATDPDAEPPGREDAEHAEDASSQVGPRPGFPVMENPRAENRPLKGEPTTREPSSLRDEDMRPPGASVRSLRAVPSPADDGLFPADTAAAPAPPPPDPGPTEPTFANFYARYPKKRDRGHAEKAWREVLRAGAKPQAIMDGLELFCEHLPLDPQYIKYPATWLRGWCWLDEVDPDQTGQRGRAQAYSNDQWDDPDDPAGGWGDAALGKRQ